MELLKSRFLKEIHERRKWIINNLKDKVILNYWVPDTSPHMKIHTIWVEDGLLMMRYSNRGNTMEWNKYFEFYSFDSLDILDKIIKDMNEKV